MDLVKLFEAYYECRKNKRNTLNALEFETDYESKLFELHREITERRYEIRPSIAFIVDKPVKREIFAGDFRDRIVHHYVIRELEPVFERMFVHDSYSCRQGRGTGMAVERMRKFAIGVTRNSTRPAWYLKLDIRSFFMSIRRETLLGMLRKIIDGKYA